MIQRMVVFGASGDLTRRLLMPAVAELLDDALLPAAPTVVGASPDPLSTEDFRQHIAEGLTEHSRAGAAARDAVVENLSFHQADVTDPADVEAVIGRDHPETLVYLALPPSLLPAALRALAQAGLTTADALGIEKPFGTDLASARELNEILRLDLPAPMVFRVDHFLSDELVQRIVALRFLNRIFEPIWNHAHIERIDISWLETLTLEGRAHYYDGTGALRDMVQNHLMEVMSLALMEPPARLDDVSFPGVRVEALRCVATPEAARLPQRSVRARYTAGTIGERRVPAYVDEPGVDPGRGTETYASLTLDVHHPRWDGVPVTLRSGKAQGVEAAELAVHFKPLPPYMRERWPGVEHNVLRMGLAEPYVCLGATMSGPQLTIRNHQLEARSQPPQHSAYAHLILQMLQERPMLFVRGDEAEEAWRITDPVAEAFAAAVVPMTEYPAGTTPTDGGGPGRSAGPG